MAEAERKQTDPAASAEANAGLQEEQPVTAQPAPVAEQGGQEPGNTDGEALRAELEAVRAELESVRTELETARGESREYLNRLARLQADWDNFRKRAQRENEEVARYANLGLVRSLLPVLDNLERALEAAAGEGASLESLKEGVALTARQFHEALNRAGVEPVPGVGEPFNPEYHEAVMQVEGDSPGETVVEEFQKGYRMGDRLVRPSMVKVAKK